jgi:hypothetical protein
MTNNRDIPAEALALARQLSALSSWLLANDLDMQMPPEVDDPVRAAALLREMAEMLTKGTNDEG